MLRYLFILSLLIIVACSCKPEKKVDVTGKWAITDVSLGAPSGEFLSVSYNKKDYIDLIYEFRKDDSLIFSNRKDPALRDAINYVVFRSGQQDNVSFGFPSDDNIYKILKLSHDTLELQKETFVLQLVRQ